MTEATGTPFVVGTCMAAPILSILPASSSTAWEGGDNSVHVWARLHNWQSVRSILTTNYDPSLEEIAAYLEGYRLPSLEQAVPWGLVSQRSLLARERCGQPLAGWSLVVSIWNR